MAVAKSEVKSGTGARRDDQAQSAAATDAVAELLRAYRAAAAAVTDVAAADARRAASAAVPIAALAFVAALAASTTWMLAMLALSALLAYAIGWPLALTVLAGSNLLVALICVVPALLIARRLTFPRLRGAFAGRSSQSNNAG
ncbi:MAG: hypothetical protein LJE69_07910 [Thiohalocapsa sp.]|uniref:hypothetical protein n=1 Tax=Thiohalocapsa sp. TaxID=2497641 RepID=UPI0025FC6A8E|nr:hypothetical protein [Thiohalocapsa sp.]MCG6941160.1 hypothetical protein [Thiohalocapsa sp.]